MRTLIIVGAATLTLIGAASWYFRAGSAEAPNDDAVPHTAETPTAPPPAPREPTVPPQEPERPIARFSDGVPVPPPEPPPIDPSLDPDRAAQTALAAERRRVELTKTAPTPPPRERPTPAVTPRARPAPDERAPEAQ